MGGFIAYFAVLSIVHLFFCYFEIRPYRVMTKPLIMLSLAVFYACAAKSVDYVVLTALICGLAGDVLLIPEKDGRFFIPGALSFTLGHALYCLAIFRRTEGTTKEHMLTAAVAITLYLIIVAYASFRIEKHVDDKKMRVLMPTYLGIVAAVNIFAWVNLASKISAGSGIFASSLITLGSMLFLTSDTILARSMFVKDVRRPNFPVMLTYIPAQLLLCVGFVLMNAK